MSVTGVFSSSGFNHPVQTQYQQRVADFQQLAQALQSGDLAGAQQAFSALAALTETGSRRGSSQSSQLAQDFNAIGQALQSGDLTGAQQAFATFQQDLQTARAPRGHHSPGGTGQNANATSAPEIVFNLGNAGGNQNPEQITLSLANGSNGGEQLTIGVSNGSGTPEQITLNLNNLTATPEIILNLGNGGAGANPSQAAGNQLSVTA
jgi:hypothetical protein